VCVCGEREREREHCHMREIAQLHVKRYEISDQAVQIEMWEFRPKVCVFVSLDMVD
jgi:hypothetical protein